MNRLYQAEIEKNMNFSDRMMCNLIQIILLQKKVKWLEDMLNIPEIFNYDIYIVNRFKLRTRQYYFIQNNDHELVFINLKPTLSIPPIIYVDIKNLPRVYVYT